MPARLWPDIAALPPRPTPCFPTWADRRYRRAPAVRRSRRCAPRPICTTPRHSAAPAAPARCGRCEFGRRGGPNLADHRAAAGEHQQRRRAGCADRPLHQRTRCAARGVCCAQAAARHVRGCCAWRAARRLRCGRVAPPAAAALWSIAVDRTWAVVAAFADLHLAAGLAAGVSRPRAALGRCSFGTAAACMLCRERAGQVP